MHQKKKVGKVWLEPRYTRAETLHLSSGDTIDVLAGTQCVDGLCKRLRASIGEAHSSDFPRVDLLVRYTHWRACDNGDGSLGGFPIDFANLGIGF